MAVFRLIRNRLKQHLSPDVKGDPEADSLQNLGAKLFGRLNRAALMVCVEQLKRCPSGLDPGLFRCLGSGVGFHHAGALHKNYIITTQCYVYLELSDAALFWVWSQSSTCYL
ncbi:unnamed protein product [Protopolystoma xenopodis]|uniref:Uncharacterized protein n=1 Tax=Protopolystoma xenopodis TaxID=117903 RepID=A0A3S5C428_9PLAT|nr:unnamed protein product [Protopolystoma xenopodis]